MRAAVLSPNKPRPKPIGAICEGREDGEVEGEAAGERATTPRPYKGSPEANREVFRGLEEATGG